MADEKVELPAFQAALHRNNYGLSVASWYRYQRGFVPEVIRWLIQHPHLLRALAADAEAQQAHASQLQRSHDRPL